MNSHVKVVRNEKGESGVRELEKRFGRPVNFANFEDVLVSDEIKIIEYALDILTDGKVSPDKRAFEAGRLHFKDFATTPLAKIIFSSITDIKKLLLNSKYIAEHVFNGITFISSDNGPDSVKIIMEGGHYPIDHFKGLFWAWVDNFGYEPDVKAVQAGSERYEYTLSWTSKK